MANQRPNNHIETELSRDLGLTSALAIGIGALIARRRKYPDIMLVKFVGDAPINHILLPTAGGEHAQWAEQYCATIARAVDGSVTVCRVVPEDESRTDAEIHRERLKPAVERTFEDGGFTIKSKVIHNDSIADGIIEAAGDYDAIMVGATRQSIYPQILFGNIPEKIAMGADKNGHHGKTPRPGESAAGEGCRRVIIFDLRPSQ